MDSANLIYIFVLSVQDVAQQAQVWILSLQKLQQSVGKQEHLPNLGTKVPEMHQMGSAV